MIEGLGISETPPDPGCLESREIPGVFLRLHTPREQIALPYASLLKLSLKLDETGLELLFLTHQVAVSGKNLGEIYRTVAEAQARIVRVAPEIFTPEAKLSPNKPLVHGIRIDPVDADERRKR